MEVKEMKGILSELRRQIQNKMKLASKSRVIKAYCAGRITVNKKTGL
jgi:hypothetical protein